MKRIALDLLVLVIATSVAVILIDHQIRLAMGPYLILVNVIPAVFFACMLYGLTTRAPFSFIATIIVQTLVITADVQKNRILHSHLSYADIKLLPMFLQDPQLIVGFVAKGGLLLTGTVIVLLLLVGFWRLRRTKMSPQFRAIVAGSTALFLVAVVANKSTIPLPSRGWNPFQQTEEATYFGVTANLLFGARDAVSVLIRSDPTAVERFHDEASVHSAIAEIHQATTLRPDIVIVQSESLFEPSSLCGLPDEPILTTIAESKPSNLHVPVFGGRTLQTEFEVLSGAPTKFFPGNQFAYFDLLKRPVAALPNVLSVLGYRTIAIHPNERDFWRRSFAIPALGFEYFIDKTAFSDRDIGLQGHISDSALTAAVLSELSATSDPTMVFAISMQNHGPWGADTPGEDAADRELTDYVQRAKAADSSWKELTDALDKRNRPTVALIYGDHLPGLASTYKERCFKDGKKATEHWPPVAVWSNFNVPPLPHEMSSYLIPGWVMEAAQLPMTSYLRANAAARRAMKSATNEAFRQKLFDEYGSIAANMLLSGTKRQDAAEIVLDQREIGKLLPRLLSAGKSNPSVKQDILFDPSSAGDLATLKLDGKVGSITFRPYTIDATCTGAQRLTYSADNHQLATGVIDRAANITTVMLDGVNQLVIKRDRQNSEARCWPVTLRLVQMQCTTIGCGTHH
ncbi:LTA synthase family protein [Rhodanobacter sp. Col0626]|uniref:LTA synthase family protein n=1 Tax=Rhodanobacter sp. Col0626 TaxID=3415679 RepID=UPI003CEC7678